LKHIINDLARVSVVGRPNGHFYENSTVEFPRHSVGMVVHFWFG